MNLRKTSLGRALCILGIAFTTATPAVFADTPAADISGALTALYGSSVVFPTAHTGQKVATLAQLQQAVVYVITGTSSANVSAMGTAVPQDTAADMTYLIQNLSVANQPSYAVGLATEALNTLSSSGEANYLEPVAVAAAGFTFGTGATAAATTDSTQQSIAKLAVTRDNINNYADVPAIISQILTVSRQNSAAQGALVASALNGASTAWNQAASASYFSQIAQQVLTTDSISAPGDFLAKLFSTSVSSNVWVAGFMEGYASNASSVSALQNFASLLTSSTVAATADAVKLQAAIGLVTDGTTTSAFNDTENDVLYKVTAGILGTGYDSTTLKTAVAENAGRAAFAVSMITAFPGFAPDIATGAASVLSPAGTGLPPSYSDIAAFTATVTGAKAVTSASNGGLTNIDAVAAGIASVSPVSNFSSSTDNGLLWQEAVTQGAVKANAGTPANVAAIVNTIAQQVLTSATGGQTTFANNFTTAITGTSVAYATTDTVRGEEAASLVNLYATYSSGAYASAVPTIATDAALNSGGKNGGGNDTPTTIETVVTPVLNALYTLGSSEIAPTSVAVSEMSGSYVVKTGTVSNTVSFSPDLLAAYLILGAKTNTSLIGQIAVADATSSGITSLYPILLGGGNSGADAFIKALAGQSVITTNATSINAVAVALAQAGSFQPAVIARDVTQGSVANGLSIAKAIISAIPSSDVAVSGSVAGLLTTQNKLTLATNVSVQVTGSAIGTPGDVAAIAATIAATVSGTDTVNQSAIAKNAATALKSGTTNGIANITLIPSVAAAVATGTNGVIPTLAAQAAIAKNVAGIVASVGSATATAVENVAINVTGYDPVASAGAFSAATPTYSVALATLAANNVMLSSTQVASIASAAAAGAASPSAYDANIAKAVTTLWPTLAPNIALAVATSSTSTALNDSVKEAIAGGVIANALLTGSGQGQDSAVANTIAGTLTIAADKATLATQLATLLTGSNYSAYTVDIPSVAASIAATLSGTDALDQSNVAKNAATLLKTGTVNPTLIPSVAAAVATGTDGLTPTLATQAAIAKAVAAVLASQGSATATAVENVAINVTGYDPVASAGAFSAALPTYSVALATLAANNVMLSSTQVSSIAAAAAAGAATPATYDANIAKAITTLWPSLAPNIALAVATSSTSTALNDSVKEGIASAVIGNALLTGSGQGQDSAVAHAVAGTLTVAADKATLSTQLATLLSGSAYSSYTVDIPSVAAGIAATLSGTDTVNQSAVAKNAATVLNTLSNSYLIPAVATAIAGGTNGETPTLATQASIASAVAGVNASLAVTTATSVEQVAIAGGADRTATAAAFAGAITTGTIPVVIAQFASNGQSAALAGSIGASVAVVLQSKAAADIPLIAVAVAQVALTPPEEQHTPPNETPGSPSDENFSETLAAVAAQFAMVTGTSAGQISFANATIVAVALLNADVNKGGDQLAASIGSAFAAQIGSTNSTAINSLITAMVKASPNSAPDILGSVIEALGLSSSDPLVAQFKATATSALPVSLRTTAAGALTNAVTDATNGSNDYSSGTIDADETPIVPI